MIILNMLTKIILKKKSISIEDKIYKKIDYIIKHNKFNNKYIVLFGANSFSEKVWNYLNIKGIKVNRVIDNSIHKQHSIFADVEVLAPEEALKEYNQNAVILIASQYYDEMQQQLERMNYKKKKNIIKLANLKKVKYNYKDITDIKSYIGQLCEVYKGYEIFRFITKQYSKDVIIFIIPTKSTGDVYINGVYLRNYIRRKKIKKYVILVENKAGKSVLDMFGYDNIDIIDEHDVIYLIRFGIVIGYENINIKIMHWYANMHLDIIGEIEINPLNTKLSYLDYFTHCGFNNGFLPIGPLYRAPIENMSKLFEELNLNKGKTVIIAPYAQTFLSISMDVWKRIVNILLDKGFTVCTNSCGKNEPPIDGTIAIFFDLKDSISILEYAGYFLGLRSGFCDIVSSSKCKKVVIYPKSVKYKYSYDFFSFVKSGLANDIEEIEYYKYNNEEFINEVIVKLLEI